MENAACEVSLAARRMCVRFRVVGGDKAHTEAAEVGAARSTLHGETVNEVAEWRLAARAAWSLKARKQASRKTSKQETNKQVNKKVIGT